MPSPSRAERLLPPRRAFALATAVGLSIVAGACGGDSDTKATATAAETGEGGGMVLTIKDFAFKPAPLVVPKGTKVKVTNSDDAPHTATADDKSFDTGTLDKGASKEITLPNAGEIAYHCTIHDYMQGVIQVRE